MCRGCRKPANMKIHIFIAHLTKMNATELPRLPPFATANLLGDDEMIEIIVYAIPNSWNKKLREQGKDQVLMTKLNFFKATEDIESSETDFEKASSSHPSGKSSSKTSKKKRSNKPNGLNGSDDQFYCLKHGKNASHDTKNCTFLKNAAKKSGNPKNTKSKNQTWKRDANKKKGESKKDLAAFIAKKVKAEVNAFHKPRKTDKKRKADLKAIEINESKDDDDTVSLDEFDYEKLEGMSFSDNDSDSFKSTVEDGSGGPTSLILPLSN